MPTKDKGYRLQDRTKDAPDAWTRNHVLLVDGLHERPGGSQPSSKIMITMSESRITEHILSLSMIDRSLYLYRVSPRSFSR